MDGTDRRNADRLYIPASIVDNSSLNSEDYEQNLMPLGPLRREQLLWGDWDVRVPGKLFDRVDFQFVDDYPREAVYVRSWDLAGSEPNEQNRDPDWTVGVKIGMTRDGRFHH